MSNPIAPLEPSCAANSNLPLRADTEPFNRTNEKIRSKIVPLLDSIGHSIPKEKQRTQYVHNLSAALESHLVHQKYLQEDSIVPNHSIQKIADTNLITVFLTHPFHTGRSPDPFTVKFPQGNSLDESFVQEIRAWNAGLDKKVIELELDDRLKLLSTIQNTTTCPLSGNIIETPVTAKCGHTFDEKSIEPNALCPIDLNPLEEMRYDLRFKGLLNELSSDFDEENLTLGEKQKGVFLLLNPKTTHLEKIENIATTLGLMQPANFFPNTRPARLYLNQNRLMKQGNQFVNRFTPLSQIINPNEAMGDILTLSIYHS